MIDRGNPHLEAIKRDADRIGIAQLGFRLGGENPRHATDAAVLKDLVELRNALAHDDEGKLLALSRAGVRRTIGYAKAVQVVLGRHARALDRVVWDNLVGLFPTTDPWSP
jgi:hypothetical protein